MIPNSNLYDNPRYDTRIPSPAPRAEPTDLDGAPISAKWLVGYAGTWLVLSALADNATTASLASALAYAIALSAAILFLPKAAQNIQGE